MPLKLNQDEGIAREQRWPPLDPTTEADDPISRRG
jgi:hypothetical protein